MFYLGRWLAHRRGLRRLDMLLLGSSRDRFWLHFWQRGRGWMTAVEIGYRIGGLRGRRRGKLIRDRIGLASLDSIATTFGAIAATPATSTAATAAARPPLAVTLAVVAGEARLLLAFVILGLGFLAGALDGGTCLAEDRFAFRTGRAFLAGRAFVARRASLARFAAAAAAPAPPPPPTLALAFLLAIAFATFGFLGQAFALFGFDFRFDQS